MGNFMIKIIKKAMWKKAILFTILFMAFYVLINFSGIGVAGLLKITGGANILDFEFGFTYEKAVDMLTALGTEGRAFYLAKILPLDFPFPFTYMLFFVGLISLLVKHTFCRKPFQFLLFIPVLTMLFDWIENIGIIVMLNNYPKLPEWTVSLSSISGILKNSFFVVNFVVIGILFVIFVYRFFFSDEERSSQAVQQHCRNACRMG